MLSALSFQLKKYSGAYIGGVHLFPFRTEKLSPIAQMVLLRKGGRVCRCRKHRAPSEKSEGAFYFPPDPELSKGHCERTLIFIF